MDTMDSELVELVELDLGFVLSVKLQHILSVVVYLFNPLSKDDLLPLDVRLQCSACHAVLCLHFSIQLVFLSL